MRTQQNEKLFNQLQQATHKPVSVMLVDDQPARAALLEQALADIGYRVIAKLATAEGLMQEVSKLKPDIIIIDVDSPDRDMLENMANLNDSNPHPIVMFAEKDAPETINRTINAGVSVYVMNEMQPQLVKSIIEVAIARFREYQALRNELDKTRNALADRKLIDKAKCLLMQHRQSTEEESYQAMRKMAMDKGQRLVTVAQNIIDLFELLDSSLGKGT
jgi:two-component system, response regulator / RNA-binding antiterminator